jgi:iron complex transport system permease protein
MKPLPVKTAKNKPIILKAVFLAVCAAVVFTLPFCGMKIISPFTLMSNSFDADIFYNIRVPRVIIGFLAGSGLALCGMVFQALFRNPLADPYTLGVSGGASFGAAMMIVLHLTGKIFGIPVIMFGSFAGAACSIALVYGFSTIQRRMSGLTMLLAGISVSFLFSSLLMFVQFISDMRHSFQILRWLMGGLEVYGYDEVWPLLAVVTVMTALIFTRLVHLDHFMIGEDIARVRGINVDKTKTILFFCTSFMVSAIVSVCGPIGFVGLMSPHICRLIFGARHRTLGFVTLVFGGTFLAACDAVARTIIAPAEIPAGVITALLGGPFFLWILFKNAKTTGESF